MPEAPETAALAWAGLITILVTPAAILSGRISALVALILVPVTAGTLAGVTIFGVLIAGLTEPMIVFMVGTMLLLLINYPNVKEQRRRINEHAPEALMMASLLFAAGVFSGILSGTGMITALAEGGTSLLPESVGSHLALIVALVSMPLSLLVDASSFYFGVLPILAEIGENFGLEKAQIAQAALLGQMTTGFPVSPLTPAPFLLVGLLALDLGAHQRFSFGLLFATTLVMTAVALVVGVFPA